MAGVVEVSLLLRQQNILLHLVREVRGGGYFDGCKLQVLQTFDLLCSGLAKKKSKKMAIDSVPIEDLTAFVHCVVFLAGASMSDAALNHFEVDSEVGPAESPFFSSQETTSSWSSPTLEWCPPFGKPGRGGAGAKGTSAQPPLLGSSGCLTSFMRKG